MAKRILFYLFAASAALGLIQLGHPLAYLTMGGWYGCYSQDVFQLILSSLRLPLVDHTFGYLNNNPTIISEIAATVLEEVLYRGPLILVLTVPFFKKHSYFYKTAVITSVAWSIIYFSATHACPLFPFWVSAVLTVLTVTTKSLIPAVLTHVLWNISLKTYLLNF